ncbi:MAG: calcium/sodium antiporter [Rhodospirillaceae bacterium]
MIDFVLLVTGVLFAAAGGELFVRGAVGLARALRVPAGVIGATVAAFATSSPELMVSTLAAVEGRPQIGLGDALGSNIVNIALVLGTTLCISAIAVSRDSVKRDLPVAVAAPVVTGFLLHDGMLSRADGTLLIAGFVMWATVTIRAAIDRRHEMSAVDALVWRASVLQSIAGLAALLIAGRLIVDGASAIALRFGVDPYIIGATIVAAGTSAPELATAVVAKLRGYDDLSVGTILGSNIFNGLAIVGLAAVITPIVVDFNIVAVTLAIGLVALAVILPGPSAVLDRRRGAVLVLFYFLHVGLTYALA